MKIRFCENNDASGVVCKRLRVEYPELNIKRKKCLKKCGMCNSSLIAVVDGNTLKGKNQEDLYLMIVEQLKAP